MTELKKHLTELIDAYAAAKGTGSQLLMQGAAASLIQFIESVEITQSEQKADGGEG